MLTYLTQYSTTMINHPRKLLRATTCDSAMLVKTYRKRHLSEQNDCHDVGNDDPHVSKRVRTESLVHDSNDGNNDQYHLLAFSSFSSFEGNSPCSILPAYKRRKSFILPNNVSYPQSTTSTTEMLVCQQTSVIDSNNENENEDQNHSSIFLTSAQVSAYMTSTINLLVIDCGLPFRHNERRINQSFQLNVNDKISRKRLINRGLKTFLEPHQLNRFDQAELIILYDDVNHFSSCSNQCQLPTVLQCIVDEIKRYDSKKTIYILQSSFDEFQQHSPQLCYISASDCSTNDNPSPSPSIDIDAYQMSEILPGLYLGNARDAEDLSLLTNNQIHSIINISTTIPCYHQKEDRFDYLHLPCNDSARENLLQHFETTFAYIHEKLTENQNVLVHCQGGISRSPSFLIGYLMKYHSKTFDQAYQLVKSKRQIINPNLNFIAQLTRYEQLLASAMH